LTEGTSVREKAEAGMAKGQKIAGVWSELWFREERGPKKRG